MAEFKCQAGQALTPDEVATMLAYDEAGVARPDAYDDVVFDGTRIQGAVYRCKTAEEKKALDEAHAAGLAAGEKRAKEVADIRAKAGATGVAFGVRSMVNDAGTGGRDVGLATAPAGDGGKTADSKSRG